MTDILTAAATLLVAVGLIIQTRFNKITIKRLAALEASTHQTPKDPTP